jgi:hypothetical protein
MSPGTKTIVTLAVITSGLASVSSAIATPLLGASFAGGAAAALYDINQDTGQASGARTTGIDNLVGIEFGAGGILYGLSSTSAPANPNSLLAIDPDTGVAQLVGATGLENVIEGDLAFDATTGRLYGLYSLDSDQRQLFTIDTDTGAATVIPGSLSGDPSAMAFDGAGTLYVVDTSLNELLTVDKDTSAILGTLPLNATLGSVAGMDVDPATGTFYLADGESGGTDKLYTLDTATGTLNEIGPLGLSDGLAGLAFLPEPATFILLAVGGLVVSKRRAG